MGGRSKTKRPQRRPQKSKRQRGDLLPQELTELWSGPLMMVSIPTLRFAPENSPDEDRQQTLITEQQGGGRRLFPL